MLPKKDRTSAPRMKFIGLLLIPTMSASSASCYPPEQMLQTTGTGSAIGTQPEANIPDHHESGHHDPKASCQQLRTFSQLFVVDAD
jgi:hypothetical protein